MDGGLPNRGGGGGPTFGKNSQKIPNFFSDRLPNNDDDDDTDNDDVLPWQARRWLSQSSYSRLLRPIIIFIVILIATTCMMIISKKYHYHDIKERLENPNHEINLMRLIIMKFMI